MRIAEIDIFLTTGDSFPIEFRLKNKKTKEPIPVAGYSWTLTVTTISTPPDNTTELFQVSGVIVDANDGKFSFTPTTLQTAVAGGYFYEVKQTDASGNDRAIIKGRFIIEEGRTK